MVDVTALDLDLYLHGKELHVPGRVPGHGFFLLPALRIDLLVEVTLPADEGDRDDGQHEVSRGLDGIAGEDAEAAAVGGDIVLDADLHGEVGDHRFGGKLMETIHAIPRRCSQSVLEQL